MARSAGNQSEILPSVPSNSDIDGRLVQRTVSLVLVILFVAIVLRTAWVGDDPFITMRSVDNFVSGYGLTWNVGERVQAFTHPLWLILLSGFYLFTNEAYYTMIMVSILISTLAVGILLMGISRNPHRAGFAAVALILSASFVEYSTSGLENPLSHLLVACFLYLFLCRQLTRGTVTALTILGSLICLNRLDLVLIVGPVLVFVLWPYRWRRGLLVLLAGTAPFTSWLVFSIVYYGYPFPNTYYAKLYTGVSFFASIRQGLHYLLDSLLVDPITIVVILSALLITVLGRRPKCMAVAAGITLYLLYVVKVGGDFMSGRFLSVPFFAGVILLSSQSLTFSLVGRLWPIVVLGALGLMGLRCPVLTDHTYGTGPGQGQIRKNGVCDERGFYFQKNALVNSRINSPDVPYGWDEARRKALEEQDSVVVKGNIGFYGYAAGRTKYIIDALALSDPLLSRLPIQDTRIWRIGHFRRELPPGYLVSRRHGRNNIMNPVLARVYDDILLITRGPIFTSERWAAIWRMNLHLNDSLIHDYSRSPSYLTYDQVSEPFAPGTAWDAMGTIFVKEIGVDIGLKQVRRDTLLEVSVDHNDDYVFLFRDGANVICSVQVARNEIANGGLRIDTIRIPVACAELGYNTITVKGAIGDGRYSFGHVRFLEARSRDTRGRK